MRAIVLGCALLCGAVQSVSVPAALAHAGHGDEFVQNGEVDQVKASPEQDQLFGITTAVPQRGRDGQLTLPSVAVVDAAGKPLVFVRSGSTYDPVFLRLGAATNDRTVVLEGVTADEQVVVSGALSLYAESQKKDRVPIEKNATASSDDQPEPEPELESFPSTSPAWLLPGGIGLAFLVILGVVVGIRSHGSGSNQG